MALPLLHTAQMRLYASQKAVVDTTDHGPQGNSEIGTRRPQPACLPSRFAQQRWKPNCGAVVVTGTGRESVRTDNV